MNNNEETGLIFSSIRPAVLDFNFDEIKSELSVKMNDYKNIVVTQETLRGCKNARGELASLRKQLDTARKEKKREAEAPIKAFDAKCKELDAMISEAQKSLDDGIKVYDDKVRQAHEDFARNEIETAVKEYGLYGRFAGMVFMQERFRNMSITKTEIRRAIADQAQAAYMAQTVFEQENESIRSAVSFENKNLGIKLAEEDFLELHANGMELNKVLSSVRKRADDIRRQEEVVKNRAAESQKPDACPAESYGNTSAISRKSVPDPDFIEIPDEFCEEEEPVNNYVIEISCDDHSFSEICHLLYETCVSYKILRKGS